ncbi:NfeD family protein [Candidatus Dependentiae bacterium]|nr:NfeD family protein [Candidatus Dependentiae bacterium]
MDSFTWWMMLLVACAFLELSSPGMFFFLSFSIGAAIAAIFSLFSANPATEFSVFLVASAGAFFVVKRYVKSISKDTMYTTNVYALRGKKAQVVEEIMPLEKGWVNVDGQLWAAVSAHNEGIEKGSIVMVINSAGSHLVVKKIDSTP